MPRILHYEGSNCFRQRIILSTLTSRRLVVQKIRLNDEEPGLTEAEISLLRLVEKITNGSTVEVDETGTMLTYTPGVLIGGKVEHECGLDRAIGYFLEVVFALAPFCKTPIDLTLKGITNDALDPSVDALRYTSLPIIRVFLKILDPNEVQLKITSRGLRPRGGGSVFFHCPVRRNLKPVQLTDAGRIKRIRGVAYACRVSPQMANRVMESAKGVLLNFLPDVYIHTEHLPGGRSGLSPGFGLTLWAETTNGVFYTGECLSTPTGVEGAEPSIPEEIGKKAAHALFEEVYRGGCVDSSAQGLSLLWMALGENDLSKVTLGPLSPYTIQFLRHLKDILQITFKLDPLSSSSRTGSKNILATCVGVGFSNLSKMVS